MNVFNEEDNRRFYLDCLRNIVKNKDGEYELQKVYELVDGKLIETEENKNNPNNNEYTKDCFVCIHRDTCGNCLLRLKLENLPEGHYVPRHYQHKCDAYTPIGSLVIVKTKDEMIDFVERSKNFFGCPEDYECYFGFERKWDEDTGEVLETVREYYNRGGEFTKIPDKYPSVIYFPYGDLSNDSYEETRFQWIYIGDVNE